MLSEKQYDALNRVQRFINKHRSSEFPTTRAYCSLADKQISLIMSFNVLYKHKYKHTVASAIILRSIIENQGNIHFLENNDIRSSAFLEYGDLFDQRLIELQKTEQYIPVESRWTTSSPEQRIATFVPHTNMNFLYDFLSSYVHGNHHVNFQLNLDVAKEALQAIIADLLVQVFSSKELSDDDRDELIKPINELISEIE